ncbi:hypothetical protein [Marinifilum sp.]|uniref:hypothetical protein n=1 Tax=Marinifilum sp. TaxID=2033137 RepID=UPI003BA8CF3F
MNNKLHNEILDVDWNDSESVIDMYERNLIYFRNYDEKEDLEAIEEIADIKLSYILALDNKKHYTKAGENLKELDILVKRLKGSEFYSKINEKYMFANGVISQRLEKFEESQSYFSQLVLIDPDNDLYRKWYDSNKEWSIYNQIKFVGYLGVALFVLNIIGSNLEYYSHNLFLKLEVFALLLIIIGFYGVGIRSFIKKKWKNEL